jgi:hypothetical protein
MFCTAAEPAAISSNSTSFVHGCGSMATVMITGALSALAAVRLNFSRCSSVSGVPTSAWAIAWPNSALA